MILTAGAPLAQLRTIVRKQDASSFPVGMCTMNAVAGVIWTIYGIMIDDIVVTFPNCVGGLLGFFQLFIIWKYPVGHTLPKTHTI